MLARILLSLPLILVPSARGQDRYDSGELQGFTKSPTEGIIKKLDEPFVVRSVSGTVIRSVGDESPLENALVELRGPGESKSIRAIKTDDKGRFHLGQLSPGKYVFKATSLGFQSVVGVVIVSPKASPGNVLNLRMTPGV
jgi:hypothetical protein